jgi:hypothetical protein
METSWRGIPLAHLLGLSTQILVTKVKSPSVTLPAQTVDDLEAQRRDRVLGIANQVSWLPTVRTINLWAGEPIAITSDAPMVGGRV